MVLKKAGCMLRSLVHLATICQALLRKEELTLFEDKSYVAHFFSVVNANFVSVLPVYLY